MPRWCLSQPEVDAWASQGSVYVLGAIQVLSLGHQNFQEQTQCLQHSLLESVGKTMSSLGPYEWETPLAIM